MKADHLILLGIFLVFLSLTGTAFQIVDTTKPNILWCVNVPNVGPVYLKNSMHPEGGDTFSELTYVYVLVQDMESGIVRVQWRIMQPDTPYIFAEKAELQYAGWASYYRMSGGEDEWTWEWGEPMPSYLGPYPETFWEIWAVNLTTPINVPDTWTFTFTVYNGAGMWADLPSEVNSTITILAGTTEEPLPPNDPTQLPQPPGTPSTPGTGTSSGISYEIPIALFAIGAIFIVYAFTQKKKRGKV